MFSKSRINEPGPKQAESEKPKAPEAPVSKPSTDFAPTAPKVKAAASVLSSDLTVVGNLRTTGDIQVEGTVEGDIRAHLLTVGESATIRKTIAIESGAHFEGSVQRQEDPLSQGRGTPAPAAAAPVAPAAYAAPSAGPDTL